MKYIWLLILLLGSTGYMSSSCPIGPSGINQWRLVEQVGNCVDTAVECLVGIPITQAECPYTISTPGVYTVCENISIIDGNPAILITASNVTLNLGGHSVYNGGSGQTIQCSGATSVRICNGFLGTESFAALYVLNSTQVEVFNIDVFRINFSAIIISNSIDVSIENCNVMRNDLSNPGPVFNVVGSSDGIVLRSCTVINARNHGLSINIPSANTAYGILVENCHFSSSATDNNGTGFIVQNAGPTPILFKNCSACTFRNGFSVTGSANIHFDSCYAFDVAGGVGFTFNNCDLGLLENCEAYQILNTAYSLNNCTKFTLNNCTAKADSDSAPGFAIGGTAPAALVFNDCSSIGFTTGFSIANLSSAKFAGCVAESNSAEGFSFTDSSNIILRDCSTILNGSVGFFFGVATASTTNVIAENCIAQHNTTQGFRLDAGVRNATLSRCSSVGNNIGFSIASGVTAKITLEQCLASGNVAQGINNANAVANTVFIMDTRSQETGVYNLNGAVDVPGSAITVTY